MPDPIKAQRISTPIEGSGADVFVWRNVNAGDTCVPQICGPYPDKSIQIEAGGNPIGGNISVEGSNNPDPDTAQFTVLTDPQGNALSSISAAKLETILEHCYYVRPVIGAGVANTNIWLFLSNTRG